MITLSFRDPLKPRKFHREISDRVAKAPGYIAGLLKLNKCKRIIFLVHGYANDSEDVADAYKKVFSRIVDTDSMVVGIEWPSNGSVFGYFPDRTDAKEMGGYLGRIINNLNTIIGDVPIHIMSHSMGGRVVSESLSRLSPESICTWIAFNADVNPKKLTNGIDGDYGQHSHSVKKAYFYFSKEDRVLGFIAPVALPVARVGRVGLCEKERPRNFFEIDATVLDPNKVRHNSYKDSPVLIYHALNLMKGNE